MLHYLHAISMMLRILAKILLVRLPQVWTRSTGLIRSRLAKTALELFPSRAFQVQQNSQLERRAIPSVCCCGWTCGRTIRLEPVGLTSLISDLMGKGHYILTAITPLNFPACTGIARALVLWGRDRWPIRMRLILGCILRSSQTLQGRVCSRTVNCCMRLSRRVVAHRTAPLWSTKQFSAPTTVQLAVQGRTSWMLPSTTSSFTGRRYQRKM